MLTFYGFVVVAAVVVLVDSKLLTLQAARGSG